jgi:hypothetical protein
MDTREETGLQSLWFATTLADGTLLRHAPEETPDGASPRRLASMARSGALADLVCWLTGYPLSFQVGPSTGPHCAAALRLMHPGSPYGNDAINPVVPICSNLSDLCMRMPLALKIGLRRHLRGRTRAPEEPAVREKPAYKRTRILAENYLKQFSMGRHHAWSHPQARSSEAGADWHRLIEGFDREFVAGGGRAQASFVEQADIRDIVAGARRTTAALVRSTTLAGAAKLFTDPSDAVAAGYVPIAIEVGMDGCARSFAGLEPQSPHPATEGVSAKFILKSGIRCWYTGLVLHLDPPGDTLTWSRATVEHLVPDSRTPIGEGRRNCVVACSLMNGIVGDMPLALKFSLRRKMLASARPAWQALDAAARDEIEAAAKEAMGVLSASAWRNPGHGEGRIVAWIRLLLEYEKGFLLLEEHEKRDWLDGCNIEAVLDHARLAGSAIERGEPPPAGPAMPWNGRAATPRKQRNPTADDAKTPSRFRKTWKEEGAEGHILVAVAADADGIPVLGSWFRPGSLIKGCLPERAAAHARETGRLECFYTGARLVLALGSGKQCWAKAAEQSFMKTGIGDIPLFTSEFLARETARMPLALRLLLRRRLMRVSSSAWDIPDISTRSEIRQAVREATAEFRLDGEPLWRPGDLQEGPRRAAAVAWIEALNSIRGQARNIPRDRFLEWADEVELEGVFERAAARAMEALAGQGERQDA